MNKLLLILVPILIFGYSQNYVQLKSNAQPQLLQKHVEALVHDEQYRNYKNIQELDRVAEYIKVEIEKNGFECKYQVYEVNGRDYRNVVCDLPSDIEEIFVIGAHYDVCGDQEGADDNGSGIAGLIELSRLIYKQKNSLKTGIQLVAFTLEEPPFFGTEKMGSFIHAKSLHDSSKKVRGMIALEMIGYFSENEVQQYPSFFSWFYPSEANFIAAISNFGSNWISGLYEEALEANTDIGVEKLSAPSAIHGVDFSDHRNYWKFDYDAIMITDTAFFRNHNYHKTTDTIDTLDFVRMGKIVDGVAIMLLSSEMK